MIIQLCPKHKALLLPSIEELQYALDTFTKNCGWYSGILVVDKNRAITVTNCSNSEIAPIFATLFLLINKYPDIISYQFIEKKDIALGLPTIGFFINDEKAYQLVEILKHTHITKDGLKDKVIVP